MITNAFFENDEDLSSHSIDYSLKKLDGGRYLVSAVGGYEGGCTYVARRSGALIFSLSGFDNLIFSVKAEEKNNVTIIDDIIYLAALEKENPGYYPYNLDYSDWSDDYYLTLESAEELKIGDLICVGDAENKEDFLSGDQTNTFGRINAITKLNDGRTLLILTRPSLSEVFDEFEIYTEKITLLEKISDTPEVEEQLLLSLLSDPEFASLISIAYSESEAYIFSRGLSAKYSSFAEFVESIEINTKTSFEPTLIESNNGDYIMARIELTGEGRIPIMSGENVIGEIAIEFSAWAGIDSLSMKMWMEDGRYGDSLDFTFEMNRDTSFGFSFDLSLFLDFDPDEELYCLDFTSDLYHYRGCKNLSDDPSEFGAISISEMHSILLSGGTNQCEICHPIDDMKNDILVLDNGSMEYHRAECNNSGKINKANLFFTERIGSMLEEEGYTSCTECEARTAVKTSFEKRIIDRINRGDFEDYREELYGLLEISERKNFEIPLGDYLVSLSGIDVERISLSLYFDFHITAALHYEYEASQNFVVGFRNSENGLKHYESMTRSDLLKNELTLFGKAEIMIAEESLVNIYIKGFSHVIYGNFDIRSGIYSSSEGGIIIDNEEFSGNEGAMHESGIRLSVSGGFHLPDSDIDYTKFIDHELPFVSYGNETEEDSE